MKKRFCYILISLFLSIAITNAQFVISGKIIDATSQQPLVAASIVELENNKHATLSDQDGKFLLRVNSSNSMIRVSFIGFQSTTVNISTRSFLRIEMQPSAIHLSDVVIGNKNLQQKFSSLAKVDLDLHPVKSTQELMRIVPGLFVAQHAGGGKAEQIFLRGFDCDHGTDIAVTVDGLPVNMVSHAHGQGYADAHFIIPETINSIDYGTGPYYAQHGNLNTAGYINFSTYDNITNSLIQLEGGKYNTVRALAMIDLIKKNKEKQSAYIASDFNYSDGPTINEQNFNRFNLYGKYNLTLSPKTYLTFSASGFKSKWDASGQVPERAVLNGAIDRFGSIDPTEGGHTERYNLNTILAHSFSESLSLINQAYFTRNIFNLYSNFTFYLNDPVNGDEIIQSEKRTMIGYSSRLVKKNRYENWSMNSSYALGIRADAINNTMLAHARKRIFLNYLELGDIREQNFYGFMQQQVIFRNWIIEAGLRWDYLSFNYLNKLTALQLPDQGKSILSPKLSVQYTLNKKLQVYTKAGKGFHSNDARVVVANKGDNILPAAYGADLGMIAKPIDNLLLNVAAYYLFLGQEFVYVGDDGNIERSGKTTRTGLDFMARYQVSKNIFANLNVNLTKARSINEPKGADHIPLAPQATSTGGLFYRKKQGFNGGLSYRYIKDRPANADNSIIARGYLLLDASVNYSRSKYEVGLAMENILNIDWNEAQFATQSRLFNEPAAISELNFTPGTPYFIKAKLAVFFR